MAGDHPKESHRAATEIRAEAEQTRGGGVCVTQSTGSQVRTDHPSGGKANPRGDCVLGGGPLCLLGVSSEDILVQRAGDTPKASPEGQCGSFGASVSETSSWDHFQLF